MKKIILAIMALFLVNVMHSQDFQQSNTKGIIYNGSINSNIGLYPSCYTPCFKNADERFMGDSIVNSIQDNLHYIGGSQTPNSETEVIQVQDTSLLSVRTYKHSDLQDSINWDGHKHIAEYDTNGKLLMVKQLTHLGTSEDEYNQGIYNTHIWIVTDSVHYDYDSEGRLSSVKKYTYTFNDAGKQTLEKAETAAFSYKESGHTITHTQTINNKEELLSSESYEYTKNGFKWKELSMKNSVEFVFDANNRWASIGGSPVTYTNDGFSYERNVDDKLPLRKYEYHYQSGVPVKEIIYEKDNGEFVQRYVQTTNYYKKGLIAMDIASITNDEKVYTAGGSITIETEKAATVSVYTFGGQMLKQQTVAAGTTQIPMAKGLYIVTVNGEGYKVLVK